MIKIINNFKLKIWLVCIILISACANHPKRDLNSFSQSNAPCFDRVVEPYTSIVDSHIHFRPFGGPAIPFNELIEYFKKTGVRFVNAYGIGQILPIDSTCTYYLDCPGTPALPSIKNDFANAANYLEYKPKDIHLVLSMSFTDFTNPQETVRMIKLYDKEYPSLFKWMGEINLVKEALFKNAHHAATMQDIAHWKDFMNLLQKRGIPLNIHADLGDDSDLLKYLPLIEKVITLYPKNKIIWSHLGLSKQITHITPAEHIAILKKLLDQDDNLMLDLSWRILDDYFFSKPIVRDQYVKFLNQYYNRILTGTDFVAARGKDFSVYQEELTITSKINQYLNDEAFRQIALGGNYFRLLNLPYQPPKICQRIN